MEWLYPPPAIAAAGAEDEQEPADEVPAAGEHADEQADEPPHPADEARAARPARDPGAVVVMWF